MKRAFLPPFTILALLAAPTFAASPSMPTHHGSVTAGVELANTSSRRVDVAGTVRFLDRWSANAGVARSDVQLPDLDTQSTFAAANLAYDFGTFGLAAEFRHSEIDHVSRSRDWLVRGNTGYRDVRFMLEIGRRGSTLAPSAFTEDLGGGLGVVSGISRCQVDGVGYKGGIYYDPPEWSAYATLRVFDYDAFDCALDITAGGGPPAHGLPPQARGRAVGRRLAHATLDVVSGATSRLVPHEAALLESSAVLGFTRPVSSQWIGNIELARDVEKLDGSAYLTGIVSATRQVDDTWSLEFSVGYSLADTIDDTAFAGIRVTAAL